MDLFVYLDNKYIGILSIEFVKGKEITSFCYDDNYLSSIKGATTLFDPEISPFKGRQYSYKNIFGFVSDTLPDRFGRVLINKQEEELAKKENRLPRKLNELDYLVRVNDITRSGAIRFKVDKTGEYINDAKDAVPLYIYLRDIEQASIEFEKNGTLENKKYQRLLLPGSSLGGARPKANIYYNDELWIAKFPSSSDTYDVEAWEKVMFDLMSLVNINVTDNRIEKLSPYGSTFLLKRFDRDGKRRVHYASFITMLNVEDGNRDVSYVDIADFIRTQCIDVETNLNELYKRIVFNYIVNNTDNHLRNIGLLLTEKGWTLSPNFDVNPSFYIADYALPIVNGKYHIEYDDLIENAKYFLLEKEKAQTIIKDMKITIIDNIEKLAFKYGIEKNSVSAILSIIKNK